MSQRYDHAKTLNLAIGPVKRKVFTDPSHKAGSFEKIIDGMFLDDNVKRTAKMIFSVVKTTGAFLPFVNYMDGGVILTYDNDQERQHYILYILIHPEHSVRYQVSKRAVVNSDHDWKYITDTDKIPKTIAYLGHYIQGTLDTEPTLTI